MIRRYSEPLTQVPKYLSAIFMATKTRAEIVRELERAERPSPPKYDLARQLFRRVLEGGLSFKDAIRQAQLAPDETIRKCAIDILQHSEKFLCNESPARVGQITGLSMVLRNGTEIDVSPVWVRHLRPERVMVLHFWLTPLSPRQLSAAAAVLEAGLVRCHPRLQKCEIDFITVSKPELASGRRFQKYNWSKLQPLDDDALTSFFEPLCKAWSDYKKRGPRKIRGRQKHPEFSW